MPSIQTGSGGTVARRFWGADIKNLGTGREPRADPGLDPKPFSLVIALGRVLLGPYQMQKALGSGRQQLAVVNAQYTQATCRIQIARALDLDQFQLEGSPIAPAPSSKPL